MLNKNYNLIFSTPMPIIISFIFCILFNNPLLSQTINKKIVSTQVALVH